MSEPETRLTAAVTRSVGIGSVSITAGANYLGTSSIDNSVNLDEIADIEVEWQCSSAPTEDKTMEVYLLYAMDGSNYEDGGNSVDPKKGLVGIVRAFNDTDTHRTLIEGVCLRPYPFKVLIKSDFDQDATVTVTLKTYNLKVVS